MKRRSIFKTLAALFVFPNHSVSPKPFTMKIEKAVVYAGTRKLRVGWSKEAEECMMNLMNIHVDKDDRIV